MEDIRIKLQKQALTKDLRKSLPEGPGVYVFFSGNKIIYIGKAINLKRRVSSYFDLHLLGKTARMVTEATHLSYIKVESELESLLLEARLIRKFMPHYNVAAKDDKHPLYIIITKEKYPRVITARKADLPVRPYALFGPFPSSANVRSVLKMLRRIFPYSEHKLGKRGCLYSHIGLCRPCPSEIESLAKTSKRVFLHKVYLKNIKRIKAVLSGRFTSVKQTLFLEMSRDSRELKYEDAAELRNKIRSLDYITQPQIPTDFYIQNPNLYEDIRKKELSDLNKLLKLKTLKRIECFDIAHFAGKNATASMVTFIDGEADKTFYRHFRIRQVKGASDYDSMKEVVKRRLKHLDDWGKPDLIIVDGGKGQVNSFLSVMRAKQVKIPVVGIAKHPDRLILGEEKIKLTGPRLQLVSRIRDEAHRFARRYHHQLLSRKISS